MKLYYLDKPGCRHISKITKSVSIIYQLEQELYPYLIVDFLPEKYHQLYPQGGVLIYAGSEQIYKPYHFDNPQEINDLRDLLWILLKKYHNITDVTRSDGSIDFSNSGGVNHVIQGFRNKVLQTRNICPPPLKKIHDPMYYKTLHWSYRDPTNPDISKNTCKKIHRQGCIDNYPCHSDIYKRCISESDYLCDLYYDVIRDKKNKQVLNSRKYLYDKLKENKFIIDKKMYDDLRFSGLIDDSGNLVVENFEDLYGYNKNYLIIIILISVLFIIYLKR
jgi:hypothetical protein